MSATRSQSLLSLQTHLKRLMEDDNGRYYADAMYRAHAMGNALLALAVEYQRLAAEKPDARQKVTPNGP